MRKILQSLDHVESNNNVLIVYMKDLCTQVQVLDELLFRLQQAHLAVRPTKFLFGSKTAKFLGCLAAGDCITTKEKYLEKIRQAKLPTTKKKVRSFLGLANCYLDHIPSFAAIAAPLSGLKRKGLPERVRRNSPQQKAFVALRENLLHRPVLRIYDQAKPFDLRTDASNCGLGASLMQEHDGKFYSVEYSSRKLTSAERRYSTLKKKCLAIV